MPEKKRILHLITGLEVGGAEMMLLKTLPQLQSSFDNCVCCIVGRGPMGKRLENVGIPVFYLDLRPISIFGSILCFRSIIKDFRPDILVTYLIHADLFGRIFGRLFGIKKIICNQRGKLLQWEFLRRVDYVTKSLVTKYIVQTKVAQRELMQKLRLPEERFIVIPNAIDTEEFNFEMDYGKKQAALSLKSDDMVITCVSKLRRGKGHEYLLEAFESLSLRGSEATAAIQSPHLKLLIVGDGEQKEKLFKQVTSYTSKSNILFLGNRSDIKEILKISDIFVLATEGEGMSNAIMEAMASGLTVITTDIPENRELVEHERTGILVPTEDSSSLAKAIEDLLGDGQRRKNLGENSKRNISKNFGAEIVVSKLTGFFDEL